MGVSPSQPADDFYAHDRSDHRWGRRRGALGGKVCGAGGGGCVALLVEPDARAGVEAAVTSSGGTVLPLRIDREGVRVGVESSGNQDRTR